MARSHGWCWESPPALNPAGGVGEVVDDFGGLKAYVAGSAESKAAVILVSDIFGNCLSSIARIKVLYFISKISLQESPELLFPFFTGYEAPKLRYPSFFAPLK
jgi:hypothetical protein